MKYSVVISTYNRQGDLEKCVGSVLNQTELPDEVMIFDDGTLSKNFVSPLLKSIRDGGIKGTYYKKNNSRSTEVKGDASSRMLGLRMARNDVVLTLDDDIILDEGSCSALIRVWEDEENNPKLMGVGMVITNLGQKWSWLNGLFNAFFGIRTKYKWDITSVGCQTWDDNIKKREKGYYLHGGVASYRKKLALTIGFKELRGKDVDFCSRAKRAGYHFIIEPRARAMHMRSSLGRPSEYRAGFKEGRGRWIIYNEIPNKSLGHTLLFCWSNFGWILRQVLFLRPTRAIGIIVGFFRR